MTSRKIKLNIITLFPEIIKSHLAYLPFKKASERHLIEFNLINLRDHAVDDYGSVDDKPYGGGTGMLLRVEPIYSALKDLDLIKEDEQGGIVKIRSQNSLVILFSPQGKTFEQEKARTYSKLQELTLICGRYEGVDVRVRHFVDEVVSIGPFILSGGELAALAVMESTTRLLPGILEKKEAVQIESFSSGRETALEYPQYTRPEKFKGLQVPEVLLSGNHQEIEKWRKDNSLTTEEK